MYMTINMEYRHFAQAAKLSPCLAKFFYGPPMPADYKNAYTERISIPLIITKDPVTFPGKIKVGK